MSEYDGNVFRVRPGAEFNLMTAERTEHRWRYANEEDTAGLVADMLKDMVSGDQIEIERVNISKSELAALTDNGVLADA